MKIRNGDERDLEGILSLRRLVFGEFEKEKLQADFWKWEFMNGPDGKAFINIAEEGGKLAGHFADIPRRFSINGEEVIGTQSADLMVHPEYRRRGIFYEMGAYAAQQVKQGNGLFMMGFPIRKETSEGLLKIGWEKVTQLPVMVYPIRFEGIINRYLRFKPLSSLVGGVLNCFYSLFQGVKRKRRDPFPEPEEVRHPDGKFDLFWEKARLLFSIHGVRDQTFLTWRYFTHPARKYVLYRAFKNREMMGYIVLRKVDLLGFNSAVMVDLLALDDDTVRALIARGIEWSRSAGADLLGSMIPRGHPYAQMMKGLGFLTSPKAFQLMIYRIDREKISLAPEAWYVNWGDTDVI